MRMFDDCPESRIIAMHKSESVSLFSHRWPEDDNSKTATGGKLFGAYPLSFCLERFPPTLVDYPFGDPLRGLSRGEICANPFA
jgi:hypothetical protein